MANLSVEASAFLILFARIGAVLMFLPVFSEDAVPSRIRLLLALGMTAGLWGLLGNHILPIAAKPAALPGILAAELMVGGSMGMIVRMMFQAAAMAGSIVSLQIGLSSALINDPSQGGQAPLLSKYVSMSATLVCLALGVHHLWIAAMVHSYALFPVGVLPPGAGFAQLAIEVVGRAMVLAISLSAPMLVYGIVLNIALGLAVRMAPSIQIFFIAQPLNILFGVSLFGIILGPLLAGFADAMTGWMQTTWV